MNGVLFDKNHATLVQYPVGLIGSYTIPDGVINIGSEAFTGSTLSNVVIPHSVTSIGEFAFGGGQLNSIIVPNSVTSIGSYAFFDCYELAAVYFLGNAPAADSTVFQLKHGYYESTFYYYFYNATAYYLPGTTGWDDFSANTGVPTALWLPQVQTGDASFGVQTNQFGFNINWASGQTVVVEACTNPASLVWQPIQTNTLTSDSVYFSDPQWANYPTRFYRLRLP